MGGFPPEAWERPQRDGDANQGNANQGNGGGSGGGNGGGNGGNGQRQQPSGPFRIDNELNILPHETPGARTPPHPSLRPNLKPTLNPPPNPHPNPHPNP